MTKRTSIESLNGGEQHSLTSAMGGKPTRLGYHHDMVDEPRNKWSGLSVSDWRADLVVLLSADDVSLSAIVEEAVTGFGLPPIDSIRLARDVVADMLATGARPIFSPYASERPCEPISGFEGDPHQAATKLLNEMLAPGRKPSWLDPWLRHPKVLPSRTLQLKISPNYKK